MEEYLRKNYDRYRRLEERKAYGFQLNQNELDFLCRHKRIQMAQVDPALPGYPHYEDVEDAWACVVNVHTWRGA